MRTTACLCLLSSACCLQLAPYSSSGRSAVRPRMAATTDELSTWLVERAGVSPKFLGAVLATCDEQMIGTVDNLQMLQSGGQLGSVFKPVIAASIESALSGGGAPVSAASAPANGAGAPALSLQDVKRQLMVNRQSTWGNEAELRTNLDMFLKQENAKLGSWDSDSQTWANAFVQVGGAVATAAPAAAPAAAPVAAAAPPPPAAVPPPAAAAPAVAAPPAPAAPVGAARLPTLASLSRPPPPASFATQSWGWGGGERTRTWTWNWTPSPSPKPKRRPCARPRPPHPSRPPRPPRPPHPPRPPRPPLCLRGRPQQEHVHRDAQDARRRHSLRVPARPVRARRGRGAGDRGCRRPAVRLPRGLVLGVHRQGPPPRPRPLLLASTPTSSAPRHLLPPVTPRRLPRRRSCLARWT